MSLIQKQIFQGVKNVKNCILTLNFTFLGQLGSLITSRHAFRSSWNFQKLMQVRYTWLKDISGCEHFLSKIQGFIKLQKKNHVECFFQFLMLNISSIKELLHKPSEIQWNITGTLPGKLKTKVSWAFPTICYPQKSQKCEKLLFWGILWGPGNQCGIQWFFMILWISESFSLYLLVKNSFNFKLGFFTYFEDTSGVIIRKNILRSDYHSARWYWCKKDQKNFLQTSHKICS